MLPIIKSLWIGSSLTLMEKLCIRSFLKFGHAFHLYLYEALDGVPEGAVVKDAAAVIPKERIFSNAGGTYAMFSNLFRYKLLEKEGGIWVDMDVICLKPFNFQGDYVFASEKDKTGNDTAATCVMRTPKDAAIMGDCYALASKMQPDVPWGSAGPKLLKEQIALHGLGGFLSPHDHFCQTHWWQTEQFVSPDNHPQHAFASFAVHLWRDMWRRKGLDVNRAIPGSFYARLLENYGVI